jgi:polyhydroxyalkanoate synthase subunit PhaC
VTAAVDIGIILWENAYRSAALLGGQPRFVLSTSGHIQALINPPGPESRASYRVTEETQEGPEAFLEQVPVQRGSWWPDYVEWLHARSGELKGAPTKLGSRKHKPAAKAPGSYVHAS